MVSLWESSDDKRDRALGLAGLLGAVHSLRILAERGIASPDDIALSSVGIKQVLDTVPPHSMDARLMGELDAMLDSLVEAARQNFGKAS